GIVAQFDVASTIGWEPRSAPVGADFGEDIKEAADHETARDRPDGCLTGGLKSGTFAEHETGTSQIQREHFGIKKALVAGIGGVSQLNLDIGVAGAGIEGNAVVNRDLEIKLGVEVVNLGDAQRRRG